MNPFEAIHQRLAAPNVFLMEASSPGPCRIVIEDPTDDQITAATALAAEFELECLVGDDDIVIERPYETECAFHEVRPSALTGNPWLPAADLPPDSLILAFIFTADRQTGCAIREDGHWYWNEAARPPVESPITHWFRTPPPPDEWDV